MAKRTEEATARVLLDGKDASFELKQLELKAKDLRKEMIELAKANDKAGFEKKAVELAGVKKEMTQYKVVTSEVTAVLKNLSGATLNELTKAQRQTRSELRNTKRDTEEYIQKLKELKKIEEEIAKATGTKKTSLFSNIFGAVTLSNVAMRGFDFIKSKISDALKVIGEFEIALNSLGAITGLKGKDLDDLGDKAIKMSTSFSNSKERIVKTAPEILNAMQLVGSAKPELLKNADALAEVTKNAIILQQASGGKIPLETAVNSLTKVMNQYNAPAALAKEYTNLFAAAAKEGAGEIDYVADAVLRYGTAADSANIPIEKSVALAELFAEKGLESEKAGTAMRNIIIELQSDTKNYTNGQFDFNKALDNLKPIQNDVISLTKIFGKENVIAAQILAQGTEKLNQLTTAIQGTNEAYEQNALQTDNLNAKTIQMGNAWDAFILKMDKGKGALSKIVKGAVDILTEGFKNLGNLANSTEQNMANIAEDVANSQTDNLNAIIKKNKLTAEQAEKYIDGLIERQQTKLLLATDKIRFAESKGADDYLIEKLKMERLQAQAAISMLKSAKEQYATKVGDDKKTGGFGAAEEETKKIKKINEVFANAIAEQNIKAREATDDLFKFINERTQNLDENSKKFISSLRSTILNPENYQFKFVSDDQMWEERRRKMQEEYEQDIFHARNNEQRKLDITKAYAEEILKIEHEKFLSQFDEAQIFISNLNALNQAGTNLVSSLKDFELSKIKDVNRLKGESDEDYNKRFAAAEEEKKQIQKKYAAFEFAARISSIIATTAQAIINAWAIWPPNPVLSGILSAAVGVTGGIQAATATREFQKVMALSDGLYPVAADDGNTYNTTFHGPVKDTHIGTKPTLYIANEKEPELIMSGAHLRHIRMNYPGLLDAIMATRVPSYAYGSYPVLEKNTFNGNLQQTSDSNLQQTLDEMKTATKELTNEIKKGIMSKTIIDRNNVTNLGIALNDRNDIVDDVYII